MSPRRVRGVCSSTECSEPARARGLCWRHYGKWRRAALDSEIARIPDGALLAHAVADALGITTASLTRRIARGLHEPDGRAQDRNWWWPETVAGWNLEQPPDDALTAPQVAALLGLSKSRIHVLADSGDLPSDCQHGGRGAMWWHRATVEDYQRRLPHEVLWTRDLAELLGVSRETVRRPAQTSLPPDGVHGSRRWWLRSRFEPVSEPT